MGAETLGIVLGSVAAAGIGAAGASSVNSSSQSFTAGQTAEARQWQENMYHQQLGDAARLRTEQNAEYRKRLQFSAQQQKELQQYLFENYNSPVAQATALRKAGLNPSVMLGGKASPFGSQDLPSVGSAEPSQPALPSIPAASMVSSPSLLNPGQPIADSVNHIASSLAQLSQSKNLDASTDKVRKMLEVEYQNEMERLYGQKIANSYQDFYTAFMKTNLPNKFKEEVSFLSNQAMYYHAKGEESQSQKAVNEIMEKFYQQKVDLNEPLVRQAFMYCGFLLKDMEAGVRLKNAQTRSSNASAAQSYSMADFYKAVTKTENDLRIGKLTLLELDNQLKEIGVRGAERKDYNEMLTNNAKIVAMFHQFEREGLVNRDMVIALERAAYSNDRKEIEWWIDESCKVIGTASSAAQAGASVYNARTNRLDQLNGKERNAIYNKFVDSYNEHYNGTSILEHEMYDSESGGFVPTWRETRR